MKKYKREFEEKEPLWEMSNLFPNRTGLDYTIWISVKSGREKHGARIKVEGKDWEIHISISNEPKVMKEIGNVKINSKSLNKIFKFIGLNKLILLNHWNGKIDSATLGERIKSI